MAPNLLTSTGQIDHDAIQRIVDAELAKGVQNQLEDRRALATEALTRTALKQAQRFGKTAHERRLLDLQEKWDEAGYCSELRWVDQARAGLKDQIDAAKVLVAAERWVRSLDMARAA